MASTSTGYNPVGISREQYGTGGQVMRWSSLDKLYLSNGAELEAESGSTINVESGSVLNVSGKLQVKSGGELEFESGSTFNVESGGFISIAAGGAIKIATSGYLRVPVSSGTTNTTDQKLPAFGVSILTAATSNPASTGKGGPKWTLKQPKGAGYRKTIVLADTTYKVAVRLSTDKSVVGYASGKKYHSLLLIGKAGASTSMNCAELISKSSVVWMLIGKSSGLVSVAWSSWYRS